MDPELEADYLRRSQKGDLAAFEALVRLHQSGLRAWLRSQLFDRSAADDLAQETFITAFRKIANFRGDGSFDAWLRGIAHNHFCNFVRKKRDELPGNDFALEILLNEGVARTTAGNALLDTLEECLEEMEEKPRKLLESRYMRGETVRQIAKATGKGYSSLTMSLHRLRESLRECVDLKLEGAK